jgi:hypothetical protein
MSQVLAGHALFKACVRLKVMFRLLRHLGFTPAAANSAVLSTFHSGLPPDFSTLLPYRHSLKARTRLKRTTAATRAGDRVSRRNDTAPGTPPSVSSLTV